MGGSHYVLVLQGLNAPRVIECANEEDAKREAELLKRETPGAVIVCVRAYLTIYTNTEEALADARR